MDISSLNRQGYVRPKCGFSRRDRAGIGATCLVSGSVTADGTPVEYGFVSLECLDTMRQPCEATIGGGRFTVEARARLQPGRYRVRVTAPRVRVEFTPPELLPAGEILPRPPEGNSLLGDWWHTKSDLEVTLALGPNRVDIVGPASGAPQVESGR